MREVVVVAAVWALGGCAAGRLPPGLAARPLGMPAGEHQIVVHGGVAHVPAQVPSALGYRGEEPRFVVVRPLAAAIAGVAYRYGVTDRVTYAFPGMVLLAAPQDSLRWAVGAGISGLGYEAVERFAGDPRLPSEREDGLFLDVTGAGALQVPIAEGLGVLARGAGTLTFVRHEPRGLGLSAHAALIWDVVPLLSLALPVAHEATWSFLGHTPVHRLVLGGAGFGEAGSVPALSLHLADTLDLITSPYLAIDFPAVEPRFGWSLGVDVHFD